MKNGLWILAIIWAFICLTGQAFAQRSSKRKAQTEQADKYLITSNAPERASNLHLGLFPSYLDFNGYNPNFGVSAQVSYLYKNKISLDGQYFYAYSDRYNDLSRVKYKTYRALPIYQAGPYSFIEGNLKMFFHSKRKEYFIMDVKKETDKGVVERSPVNAFMVINTGLRAGFSRMYSYIYDETGSYKFNGQSIHNPGSPIQPFTGDETYPITTNIEVYTIFLGFSSVTIKDFKMQKNIASYEDHGGYEFYADLLFAPVINLTDIYASNTYFRPSTSGSTVLVDFQQYQINNHTHKIPFGIRIGINNRPTKIFALTAGAECGMRPGVFSPDKNFYALLKIGFNLAARI